PSGPRDTCRSSLHGTRRIGGNRKESNLSPEGAGFTVRLREPPAFDPQGPGISPGWPSNGPCAVSRQCPPLIASMRSGAYALFWKQSHEPASEVFGLLWLPCRAEAHPTAS